MRRVTLNTFGFFVTLVMSLNIAKATDPEPICYPESVSNGSIESCCTSSTGCKLDQTNYCAKCAAGACGSGTSCSSYTPTVTFAEFKLNGDDDLAAYAQAGATNGDPVYVKLKIWAPATGTDVPRRGTILFGSGGSGNDFLSEGNDPSHDVSAMMADLAWMGFLVIDRAWATGWTATFPTGHPEQRSYGYRIAASRYAALVKEVYNKYHCSTCGAFVVAGHSGGTAEIGYGLTNYSLSSYIDLAVLISGPAIAQLDQECNNSNEDVCDTDDNDDWCGPLYCSYRPDLNLCSDDWQGRCGQGCPIPFSTVSFDRPKCVFDINDKT